MSIDGSSGDCTQVGAIERRTSFRITYERYSSARLTQSICDENKKALYVYINRSDIEVCYYEGNDWKTHENVLIISRKYKTVDNFTDLDGSVNTREVASFYYLEGTNMYELQVSKYDGYCRRVSLGEVKFGNDSAGGLQFFVERYVYMGETEEERTYNLESLAMAEQGVDILWAGMQGLQMTGIPGEWWVRLESEAFVTILSASMSIENGTLSWNMTNFCRQFAYRNSEFRPYIKAFFDNSNWIYESACYGACPIISWEDAGGTSVRAYYFKNNMKPYYVEINADTGEVGEETLVTQS